MAYAREDIFNVYDTLPARYSISFDKIVEDPEPLARDVYKGRWGNRAVAVKKFEFDNTNHNFNLASEEMARMFRLRHQNVLKVYGIKEVREGPVWKWSIVMELMDFDLYKHIEQRRDEGLPLGVDEVVYIIAEIARGMEHVHKKGYAHRDLKPQNVFMRSPVLTDLRMEVKVADFGSSELMSAGHCNQKAGSRGYKAPEQYTTDASELQPLKMDVYSFGCICFKLLTGMDPPFMNHAGLMELWKQQLPRNLQSNVEGIITKCLDIDPNVRPEFPKISGVLDAVLEESQVEQVRHREEVTGEEAAVLVKRKGEIARKLGVDGGDYDDYVILPEELIFLRILGGGGGAAVYEADWNGKRCAMKFFESAGSDTARLGMLPTISHENIVTFLGYSLTRVEEEMHPSIVMELLEFDLGNYLVGCKSDGVGLLNEQRRWKILNGIVEGMRFLHGKDWVHGDLKPANVLVKCTHKDSFDIDTVKLINFTLIDDVNPVLTTRYAAPEVLQARRDPHLWERIHPKKADVYSFAITCSDILGMDEDYGIRMHPREIKKQAFEGRRPKLPEETGEDMRFLITRCWSPDPSERPSFDDIREFLKQMLLQRGEIPSPLVPVQESTRSWSRCSLL